MKNTFKRTLALALAVVLLLSVSVIGVSAESTWDGGVNTDTVAVYEFWQEAYKGSYVYHSSKANVNADIETAFGANELNWMRYSESAGYSIFAEGRPYHEVTIGEGVASNAFYGLVIKNPGAGTYDLSLDYSKTSAGCVSVKAFLVAESVFAANSDTAWRYVIKNNMAGQNGVIYLGEFSCKDAETADYSVHTYSTTVTLDAAAGTNYHLVFSADDGDDTVKNGSNKIYINQLALEKTSADLKEANVAEYDFYNKPDGTAYSGTWYNNSANIYANYTDSGWRYEAASALYQMTVSNTFFSTTASMRFFSSANQWHAIRIKAPAAGTYNVTLDYGQVKDKAGVGDVYMFPASALDVTLNLGELDKTQAAIAALLTAGTLVESDLTLTGEAAADKLGALQGADMFSTIARGSADSTDAKGGNGINNYLETKINAQLTADTCTTLFTGIQYFNEGNTNAKASETSNTTVTFPAVGGVGYSDEYIVVFKLTSGSDLYNSKLTFTEIVDSSVAKIGEEKYNSVKAALNEADAGETVTLLADCAIADLKNQICNIDLNGNDLTVYGNMTTVAAVSDSKDGTGVLTVTGEMNLAGDQVQLPLYDAAAGGYGFYSVSWGNDNQSTAVENNASARKFWFQLFFDNAAAYELIASGTSGLAIGIDMKWAEGDDGAASFVFVDKTEKTAAAFAAGWGEFMKTAETPWIWVTVTNAIEGMTVTPVIEANGAQIACAPIAY